ncbi:hypothetical protein BGW42_007156 [Actinomortierella wolfii]|nr:hypothetical protein BGW42_007156 [Actinomortierella wolfii]
MLKTLKLSAPFVIQMEMWSKIIAFDLTDADLHVFASNGDEYPTTANMNESIEGHEAEASRFKESGNNNGAGPLSVSLCPVYGDEDSKNTQSRVSSTMKPWACTDSLVALGLDFGQYHRQEQNSLSFRHRVDAWYGGPFPTKFSTLELLQIRRRLSTLRRLQILSMGGPLMDFKIIARLADLKTFLSEEEAMEPNVQQMLQDIEDRGGAEIDSLLEHVPRHHMSSSALPVLWEREDDKLVY